MPWKALSVESGSGGWKEVYRTAGSGAWKELTFATSIDIGSACTDRGSNVTTTSTKLLKANPANASGTLTSMCVYAYAAMTGFKCGTFYYVSANRYRCRAAQSIGSLSTGENNFSISLEVATGDIIGFHFDTGGIERDDAGGDGYFYFTGDQCYAGSTETYWTSYGRTVSCYATG